MDQKQTAKQLLSAVEGSEGQSSTPWRPAVELFNPSSKSQMIEGASTKKKQQTMVLDSMECMNKRTSERFFTAIDTIITRIVSTENFLSRNEDTEEGLENSEDQTSKDCLVFMEFAARAAEKMLQILSERHEKPNMTQIVQADSPLYSVACQLHNVLISIHEAGDLAAPTKEAVVALCECWWQLNFPNRDTLIPQVLPLLVLDAYESTDTQKRQIKKLHQFTDAFQAIDFADASSDSLRSLLFKLASSPGCLHLSEGRAFLASLMRDADLASDLHQVFKMQVTHSPKSILKAFGDIYRKAWTSTQDGSIEGAQKKFEQVALQDLMYSVVHLSSESMISSLHILLEPFHADTKNPEIAALLHRLYSPILWRSLSASNARIRKNAVQVLERTFPLHDPAQNNIKIGIEKGCEALFKALQDTCPSVRGVASQASAKICVLFWSVLSAARIRKIMTLITIQHASDKSSAAVRAAAIRSVILMLGSKETHAVLRPLLPSLGNLIHDKSEKVRLATVDLLHCIKVIPDIRFYHVVSVEHLHARMVEEERVHQNAKNRVARALSSLLLSSYFPQGTNVSASDQLKRALSFMMNEPQSAAVFYANLPELLESSSLARFATMLHTCLQSAVENDGSESVSILNDTDNSVNMVAKQQLSSSNTPLMLLLAETVTSIVGALVEEGHDKTNLRKKLGIKKLLKTMDLFDRKAREPMGSDEVESDLNRKQCTKICAATVKCISFVSEGRDPKVLRLLISSMNNELKRDNCDLSLLMPHLSLLISFGMVNDVVSWLSKSLLACCEPEPRENWTGSKQGHLDVHGNSVEIPPRYASLLVDLILRGQSESSVKVREGILGVPVESERLLKALNIGITTAEQILEHETDPNQIELDNMLHCCELYGRFSLHASAHKNDAVSLNESLQTLLQWTAQKVLPTFLQFSRMTLHNLDISRISNASESMCLSEHEDTEQQTLDTSVSTEVPKDSQTLTERTARALFHSVCAVLSEFVALGEDAARTVSRHAHRWFKVLREAIDLNRTERCKAVFVDILSPLLRLSIQFGTQAENYKLLRELFLLFNWPLPDETKTQLQQGVMVILKDRSRRSDSLLNGFMGSFLDASEDLFDKSSLDTLAKDSAKDFWSKGSEHAIGVVLETVMVNPRACKAFADEARYRLRNSNPESSQATFHETCLSAVNENGQEISTGNL